MIDVLGGWKIVLLLVPVVHDHVYNESWSYVTFVRLKNRNLVHLVSKAVSAPHKILVGKEKETALGLATSLRNLLIHAYDMFYATRTCSP
jgi:hypothetical protein